MMRVQSYAVALYSKCCATLQAEAAAAQEAKRKLQEQAEADSHRDREAAATNALNGPPVEEGRPSDSGRSPGLPPGSSRTPGPPPSGTGRGQGRGASINAANGRLAVPPGMDSSREGYGLGQRGGRGRRGRVGLLTHLVPVCTCVNSMMNHVMLSPAKRRSPIAN